MSHQPPDVRERTDRLDAVGNTTKALTKGYAVGSAGLATFLLFSALIDTVKEMFAQAGRELVVIVDIATPEIFVGGLLGACLVFVFSAWSMKAVGVAAGRVVQEVRHQLETHPGILANPPTDMPDYTACVSIVTRSALLHMIRPALLVILSPVVVGVLFRLIGLATTPFLKLPDNILGIQTLSSMLMMATISGVLCGLFLNNAGGAWDNAKKLIEMEGNKGSDQHKAAVTGDTVGDPCKDTAGPSIHVLVKLLSTIALVLVPLFVTIPPPKP